MDVPYLLYLLFDNEATFGILYSEYCIVFSFKFAR